MAGIEFYVKCAQCGANLETEWRKERVGDDSLIIAPCEHCLGLADIEGFKRAEEAYDRD